MRVAHWNLFAPNASGMYETVKDIVQAQRERGLDCAMIDANNPAVVQRDGDFATETFAYADTADVYVMHSHIPAPYLGDGTPAVCCLHGMPLYSWQSECFHQERDNEAPWSQIMAYFRGGNFDRFVTFWRDHLDWWSVFDADHGGERLHYVPRPINLGDLTLDGPAREVAGEPSILLCDQFRLCKDPGALWFGAWHFWRDHPTATVHQYALPPENSREYKACVRTLQYPTVAPMMGLVDHIIDYLPEVMRGADILLTSVPVASRVVAEAMACGCSVVSGGARGTYACNPIDPQSVDAALERAWEARAKAGRDEARKLYAAQARDLYDPLNTADGMIAIYEELLADG